MRLRKPSPSMFVSIAALVVAMGGTSYAAVQINGQDIKAKSITSTQIKKNSLGSGVITNGSLAAKDFKKGSLPAGATGPAGPAGPAGVGRWAYIDANGTIAAQSGGFTLVAAYPTLPNTAPTGDNSLRANGNVYINANEDLSNNGIIATLTLQNTVDQNGDAITTGRAPGADSNPEFSGEVTASRCAFTGSAGIPTNCAPALAQNAKSFVVSPRMSDGSFTVAANGSAPSTRKGFYVVITGNSTDYVAP